MKIEVLFPEIGNLFGDLFNIKYLEMSLQNAVKTSDGSPIYDIDIIETHLNDKPYFVNNTPDMIYMGTMSERGQKLAVSALSQYKERLVQLIDEGTNILLTGNAFEVFGGKFIEDDKEIGTGLGILDIEVRRSSLNRLNCLYTGDFNTGSEILKIVGFKSIFGYVYGNDLEKNAFDTIVGYGSNRETSKEGIRVNNLIATHVIGPLMVLNPPFAKWYMHDLLGADCDPAYSEAAMNAYNSRVEEYLTPGKGWEY